MIIKLGDAEEFYTQIIDILKKGGIVALPTDTIYGLAVDGTNQKAIKKLSVLKRRENKPYTLFVAKKRIPDYALIKKKKLIDYFLPGPITIILKKNPELPIAWGLEKIGIRIPQTEFIIKLLNNYEIPLIVTSANLSNEPPLTSAQEIAEKFPEIDLIIDGGRIDGPPSTVLDLTTTPPTILRKGKIPILEIEKIYGRPILLDDSLKFNLLFVCTGNTCRSPMAAGIIKTMVRDEYLNVSTAGTAAIDGLPASPNTQIVVKKFGGSIEDHRTKCLNKELIAEADLILVMEYKHYETVLELVPEAVAKTFLLKEYKRRIKYNEITDPAGKDIQVYEDTALEMYPSLKLVARDIMKRFRRKE
uniref:L-threonylcarbamoyladenylate synthase n=1 Tax=candidate division WOR-3 bacterium TaxID=2052148 RepID=A0A7C4XKR2_UNCW3